jgi:hypothetical protein
MKLKRGDLVVCVAPKYETMGLKGKVQSNHLFDVYVIWCYNSRCLEQDLRGMNYFVQNESRYIRKLSDLSPLERIVYGVDL